MKQLLIAILCMFAILILIIFNHNSQQNKIEQQEETIEIQNSIIDSLQSIVNDSQYHFYNDMTKELTYQQVDSIIKDYFTLDSTTRWFIADFAYCNENLILRMDPAATVLKSKYYKDIDANRAQAEKLKEYLYY